MHCAAVTQYQLVDFAGLDCLEPTERAAASRGLLQTDCEDDMCMELFDKCGGTDYNVSTPCCDEAHSCVVKNYFFAQCLTEERAGTVQAAHLQ
jgi:hypothetical protein